MLLLGLTPPVVGPLLAALEEPLDAAVELLDVALDDPAVAGAEELVVGVVLVEDAAL